MCYLLDTGIIGIITFVLCYEKMKKMTWSRLSVPGKDTNNLSLIISNKMSQEIEFAKIGEYN